MIIDCMYLAMSPYICIYSVIYYLLAVQTKATSFKWVQSSTPIALAGQSTSLPSVPKQRSSSSHVGESDDIPLKL